MVLPQTETITIELSYFMLYESYLCILLPSFSVTQFPKPLCPLHDIAIIVGDRQKLAALVQCFETYLSEGDMTEMWSSCNWVLNEL